ncbi:unnamed protein product [Microthlaspi erraticum]|uniref:Uncharacterized protein n=1 Tax=Microthlaspi erraticum TaxID=1685480 RepID=A0A6D2I5H6_9BRAS|nr:unnamed protein product [Microthlaspi erraticum]CAA7054815.1 unnamed protein product [Microthlaspi erraticum]
MDGAPRGRSARGRGARGRGGRAGGRAGRGRGRGLPEELGAESSLKSGPQAAACSQGRLWSGECVAQSVTTASVTQSVPLAGDASVSVGLGAAPGGGGAPAPGRDDLVVELLTHLLARFPPGAPGVPPVAGMQHVAADVVQPEAVGAGVSRYLEFMGHMQRIGTPFFEGRVGPEEADAWRQRVERKFQSICCPME